VSRLGSDDRTVFGVIAVRARQDEGKKNEEKAISLVRRPNDERIETEKRFLQEGKGVLQREVVNGV
jgi:hypothetical protein